MRKVRKSMEVDKLFAKILIGESSEELLDRIKLFKKVKRWVLAEEYPL